MVSSGLGELSSLSKTALSVLSEAGSQTSSLVQEGWDAASTFARQRIDQGASIISEGAQEVTAFLSSVYQRGVSTWERIALGVDKFREIVFVTDPIRIFDVAVEEISGTEVALSWKTNHLSTSQVNYGSAVGTYEFTSYSVQQTREHRLVLTDLNPKTTYYYELISKNRDYAVDAFRSFTTLSD